MVVVEGLSEGESDGDCSDNGQVLLGVGSQGVRKGQQIGTRLEKDQTKKGSELEFNLLGNTLVVVSSKPDAGRDAVA
ncbi:hypothetical protein A2U01_0065008, partial [Trifolium medium]|nr:hypothetical protein [Trifolium medium]